MTSTRGLGRGRTPEMPTLVPGDRITDRVYPPNGAASGWMLSWDLDAIARNSGHPARFYEVGEVSGLRWERYNGTGYWSLHFDDARVMRELPSWLAFGPNGEDVEAVLEAIADLDTHQVRRLDVPDGLEKFAIPIDRIEVPDGHALEKVADRARFLAMCWMEDRGWAIDSKAGGHYYHGCYFVYQLHDPHWLSAMGRAMNAASTAVIGGDMPAADAERARREWAEVLG